MRYCGCLILLAASNVAFAAKDAGIVRRTIEADGSISKARASAASLFAVPEQPERGQKVQELLGEFEGMAQTGSAPDMEKIRVIKKIVTEELVPDLVDTHKVATDQIKTNLLSIDQCNTNVGDRLKDIKDTTEVSVGKRRTDHATCREHEKEKTSTKDSKCEELDSFLNAINVPADEPNGKPRDEMVQYVTTMSDYFCPKGPTVTDLNAACEKAEEEHRKHKDTCDRLQGSFESAFCTWRTQLVDACDASSTCYEGAVKIYEAHVEATNELVKKWKVEYSALQKISCYTDVWLKNNNVNTADADQLKECDSNKIDTSPMDIDPGTPAAPAECSLADVEKYPGTPGFIAAEYSNFNKFTNEPIACLASGPTLQVAQAAQAGPAPTPEGVKWTFYDGAKCEGPVAWQMTLLDGGNDMSICTKWKLKDGETFYQKSICAANGITKEVYFEDSQCEVYSKSHTIGKLKVGFTVDAEHHANEKAGKCFTATLTHDGVDKVERHGILENADLVSFPTC